MDNLQLISKSIEDTNKIAAIIASVVKLDDIVILGGGLGAGKTHLVKGVAAALSCMNNVTSPTYAIANFYKIESGNIIHIDAYRLSGVAEFRDLGLDEYFEESITFVEWGKKILDEFPSCLIVDIELDEKDANHRKIMLSYKGKKWETTFKELKEKLA